MIDAEVFNAFLGYLAGPVLGAAAIAFLFSLFTELTS